MKKFGFSKDKRLTKNSDFSRILSKKIRFSDGFLVLFVDENSLGYPRLGVAVGRHFGNAVLRNRLKRLLRESFRKNQIEIPSGFDYVLMFSRQIFKGLSDEQIKQRLKTVSYEEVESSFIGLVKRFEKKNAGR